MQMNIMPIGAPAPVIKPVIVGPFFQRNCGPLDFDRCGEQSGILCKQGFQMFRFVEKGRSSSIRASRVRLESGS
jgi:hypothetical protein